MAKKDTTGNSGFLQLKNDLKQKNPGCFYIFYGEEDYLRRYYLERVKKQILTETFACCGWDISPKDVKRIAFTINKTFLLNTSTRK